MCYSIVCDKLSLNQNTIFLKTFCRVHVVYYVVYCYKEYNVNVRKLYLPYQIYQVLLNHEFS